ncbi:hypothetical protein Nm8I071_21290 [Nonomuraea sp. TT08I-71]|nr:hypothetical protein Nm8I071_21290 [Nonomuraea sp. TT08I-71]
MGRGRKAQNWLPSGRPLPGRAAAREGDPHHGDGRRIRPVTVRFRSVAGRALSGARNVPGRQADRQRSDRLAVRRGTGDSPVLRRGKGEGDDDGYRRGRTAAAGPACGGGSRRTRVGGPAGRLRIGR